MVAHSWLVARDGLVAHEASAACAATGTRDAGSHLAGCSAMDGPMDADACQRPGQARGPAPTSVTRCRPANRTQRGVVVRDSMIDMICDVVGSMSAIWPWGAPPVVAHMGSVARDGLVAYEASAACAALGTRDSGSHLAGCSAMDGPADADACQRTGQARGPAPTSVIVRRPANRTQRGVVVRDSRIGEMCDVVGSVSEIWL